MISFESYFSTKSDSYKPASNIKNDTIKGPITNPRIPKEEARLEGEDDNDRMKVADLSGNIKAKKVFYHPHQISLYKMIPMPANACPDERNHNPAGIKTAAGPTRG